MADVKWIKLTTDIFENRKIRQIEALPDGDAIIVIWIKLLCLAGNINDSGLVYFTKEIPYTDQMLSNQFCRPLTTVQMALKTFEQFGMIEVIDDVLHISNWEKYQNIDGMAKIREQTRKRVAEHRERQRISSCNVTSNDTVTHCNAIEEEREEDKEKEEEIHSFILPEEDESKKRKAIGGTLGGGVVMLSQEQEEYLLEHLSFDEFNHYLEVVRDCELKGKKFKNKTHYQAILDMARKDRKI